MSSELALNAEKDLEGLTAQQVQALDLRCQGFTIEQICRMVGASEYFLAKWRAHLPAFNRVWQVAHAIAAAKMADELRDLPTGLEYKDVPAATLKFNIYKHLMAHYDRQQFGERIDISIEQTVNIAGALAEARARLLPKRYQTDAEAAEFRVLPHDEGHGRGDNESLGPDGRPGQDATNATDGTLSS